MSISILELIEHERSNGYNETNASSKVSQDLLLFALRNSSLNRNVTIKGGVVMRSKTKNTRRATQDLDIDFIKYSLTNDSIDKFISEINCIDGISFIKFGNIEELNQQDYNGKRVHIKIVDSEGNQLITKIDLGVHKKTEIEQEEYCFDISLHDEGVKLLINSNEQMLVEKLRSLLKFGVFSTRYKDIFDIYYLIYKIDYSKLKECLEIYIFQDNGMREINIDNIVIRLHSIFNDKQYLKRLNSSDKKWIDEDNLIILNRIISFFERMRNE
jgi:predicted nucleotidyltransferase component of viral defense system